MEWFINACAVILISCVTTIMVSLTFVGVALLWARVRKDLVFFDRPALTTQDLSKMAADEFAIAYNNYRQESLRRGSLK